MLCNAQTVGWTFGQYVLTKWGWTGEWRREEISTGHGSSSLPRAHSLARSSWSGQRWERFEMLTVMILSFDGDLDQDTLELHFNCTLPQFNLKQIYLSIYFLVTLSNLFCQYGVHAFNQHSLSMRLISPCIWSYWISWERNKSHRSTLMWIVDSLTFTLSLQ